ncbi:MAG: hypothetical protein K9N40_12870 [Candidatus Cloacimonetes bacterium]|nr:hypothetical protein [Candidatus Cloacimonadota bacterium]
MLKITNNHKKEFIRNKLASDPLWAKRALLKIFEFQTEEEKEWEATRVHNNVGFTGSDGEFLTSLAKQLQKKGYLSEKQMVHVFKKMPKYWKQILNNSDEEKLIDLMLES